MTTWLNSKLQCDAILNNVFGLFFYGFMLKIHYSFSCLVEILPKCIEASHLINLDLLTTLYFLIMVCLDIKVFLNQPLILWLDLAYFLAHTLTHIFILLSLEQACQVQTTLRVA